MIDTKLYVLQAYILTEKKDEHDRNIVEWRRIYGQMNNTIFEYTTDFEEAEHGDFYGRIFDWKSVYQTNKDETVLKLYQEAKGKKKEIQKFLLLKIDESHPQDLTKLANYLDSKSKSIKEVGRPLSFNVHWARGVSALSRSATHSNYKGLVTVLLILLIISNLRNILK